MNLTKRKYINGNIHSSSSLSSRYVVVYDWGVVKINLNQVSEIEEYDSPFLFYTIKKDRDGNNDMDFASIESFCCFAFGKKILLTEKHEVLHESQSNHLTYINIEKVTMSNGKSYITIV